MIRPRVMPYSAVDFRVGIASTFCAKFPYRPVNIVFVVEELDEGVCRVAIRALRVCGGGTGGHYD